MTAATLARLWAEAAPWVEDPSLVAAPFVVAGYWLGKRKDPRSWICMAVSNALLVVIGAMSIVSGPHHLGLFVSAWLAVLALRNYRAWKREPAPGRVAA